MLDRIKTGIVGLDELTKGGFVRGTNVLVSGTPGTGKTTFALQYLYNGALSYGEPGLYLSTVEDVKTIARYFEEQGWQLSALNKKQLLTFSQFTYSGATDVKAAKVTDLVEEIKSVLSKMPDIKRLALDSVSMLSYTYESTQKQRLELSKLFGYLASRGITSIYTMERPTWDNIFTFEDFLADAVIVLHDVMTGMKRKRGVSVIKMRGTDIDRDVKPYKFSNSGITIFPKDQIL